MTITNLDKYKSDLEKLILTGRNLQNAMMLVVHKKEFIEQAKQTLGEDADEFLKKIPNFYEEYEGWYSESLALLRQLLPDRVENFISFYEKPKSRKEISYGNYVI